MVVNLAINCNMSTVNGNSQSMSFDSFFFLFILLAKEDRNIIKTIPRTAYTDNLNHLSFMSDIPHAKKPIMVH